MRIFYDPPAVPQYIPSAESPACATSSATSHLWGHLQVYIWNLGARRAELTSLCCQGCRASVVLWETSSGYGAAVFDFAFKS